MVDGRGFVCAKMVGIWIDKEKRFIDLIRSFVCICLSMTFCNRNLIDNILFVPPTSITHK